MIKKFEEFIPVSKPIIGDQEINYVTDAVKSGWVSSLGPYIDKFEKRFAEFCGTKHAITTSNGTTGLHLALIGFDIGAGDEVIVPDLSFIATANSVAYTGATPVFADIEKNSLCLDPDKLESLITPRTKAIMPVHLYGHPANMSKINEIAAKHNLIVIEDAAEAHGATVDGKRVGGLAACGVFSFYGNKIITSGEGGMITTNDDALAEKFRRLRDHAMSKIKRYWHEEVGYNYRMTNIQAALGLAQLENIDDFIQKRNKIFDHYNNKLGKIGKVKLNHKADWAEPVYWMICMESLDFTEASRDVFMKRLKELNVDSRPYFYPMSDMPMYNSKQVNTPTTHRIYSTGVNLPTFTSMTKEMIDYVSDAVIESLN